MAKMQKIAILPLFDPAFLKNLVAETLVKLGVHMQFLGVAGGARQRQFFKNPALTKGFLSGSSREVAGGVNLSLLRGLLHVELTRGVCDRGLKKA